MSAINEKAVNGTQLQRTHKKIYRHLMPLLIVAYIISFIDRTNIGMAKATMSVDIGLSATAFGLGAGLFFLTYAVLEIPSNLFLTRIGARRWIARIMITWGILSCGMAFVTGPTSFYVMRLLLGAAEAGLYPGIIYYLTLWFGREERAKATGLFLLGVCLANIIGAPLGGLLLSLDGMSGWHGWQWMFFIEGLPAIALAFVVWRRLPDKPADARWLVWRRQLALLLPAGAARRHPANDLLGKIFYRRPHQHALSAYRQPGVDAPGDAGKQPCRQRRRDEDLFTHPAQPQYFADGGQYPADANRLYGH